MSNTSRDWMESFGSWSLTFGLGYYLLSHLLEPLATRVDLAFIAGGILVLAVAAFRRRWCGRTRTADPVTQASRFSARPDS
jgi:hypothetical protein